MLHNTCDLYCDICAYCHKKELFWSTNKRIIGFLNYFYFYYYYLYKIILQTKLLNTDIVTWIMKQQISHRIFVSLFFFLCYFMVQNLSFTEKLISARNKSIFVYCVSIKLKHRLECIEGIFHFLQSLFDDYISTAQ